MTLVVETANLAPRLRSLAFIDRLRGSSARKAYLGLTDQGVLSAGNFVTGVLLARHLSTTDYGTFALLLETLLFLNSLQAALINYPVTLRAAAGDDADARSAATASLLFTLILVPVLGTAIVFASGGLLLGILCAAAMLFWQLQETLRRVLIARMRIGECLVGDSVSYLGQAAIVLALHLTGRLDLRTAFITVAGTSAAAMLIQAFQLGLGPVKREYIRRSAIEFWKLGRWVFFGNLTGLITTLLVLWALQKSNGAAAMGIFAAIVLLFKITNPVSLGLAAVITPAVAAARARRNYTGIGVGLRYLLLGTGILSPYYLLLCAAPRLALRLAYGVDSPYLAYASLLPMFVVFFYSSFLAAVLSAWLNGLGESRANFLAQLVQMGGVMAVALPMTVHYGVWGIVVGGTVTMTFTNLATIYFLYRAQGIKDSHATELFPPQAQCVIPQRPAPRRADYVGAAVG